MPLLRRSGRHRQNGGRLEIGMVGAIRSERWAASDRYRWAADVRIRTSVNRFATPPCSSDQEAIMYPSRGYPGEADCDTLRNVILEASAPRQVQIGGSNRRSHHSTVSCCLQTIRSSICTSAAKADIDPKRGVDHIVVMGERDLGHQLTNRATYHSAARTHLALDKDAPLRRPAQKLGRIMSVPSQTLPSDRRPANCLANIRTAGAA